MLKWVYAPLRLTRGDFNDLSVQDRSESAGLYVQTGKLVTYLLSAEMQVQLTYTEFEILKAASEAHI